jgi:hypothetical protein
MPVYHQGKQLPVQITQGLRATKDSLETVPLLLAILDTWTFVLNFDGTLQVAQIPHLRHADPFSVFRIRGALLDAVTAVEASTIDTGDRD